MSAPADLTTLCDSMTRAIEALMPALTTAAAQFLATRALIELLDERGLLAIEDLRERALELAELNAAAADVRAKLGEFLPDPSTALPTAGPHGLH